MAESYESQFESMDLAEFKSPRIDLTARQCLHENMILTVTKANVPGLTIQKYKDYRQNMPQEIKKVEELMTLEEGGQYEDAIFRIQKIKMPMLMTNRSVPVLLHTREPNPTTFINVGSSRGTEQCIADNQAKIGKDVVANMIISY